MKDADNRAFSGNSFRGRKQHQARIRFFLLLFISLTVWTGCSNDRGDPLAAGDKSGSFGGSLVSGADGPNLAVTEQNRLGLCQEVFSQLYSVYLKAVPAVLTAPDIAGGVRVLGNYKGYTVVRDLTDVPDTLRNNRTLYFVLAVTFFDYSESGGLFLGGSAGYSTSTEKIGAEWEQRDILLSDGLAFAGNFSGSIEFENFLLPVDPAGGLIGVGASAGELSSHLLTGEVIITSGGQTFRFNPYLWTQAPE
ncbi:MAG: hypothetical protein V1794_15165 [Candidatus Glassbacteria bacterium]